MDEIIEKVARGVIFKYEINDIEIAMSRPLTDAEMRFLLANPGVCLDPLLDDKINLREA